MENSITWTNEKRKLSQLIPWKRNPRQIKGAEVTRLQESLVEFGQVEPTAIGPDNELYNGHQRLKSWAAKFGDIEIDVRVSSRALTEKEREKLTVYLHKGAAGSWDFDTLANEFELDDLLEWGFDKKELDLDLWAGEPDEDPGAQIDKAEELREKWGVELGQMWKLGEHRIICGDCTDRALINYLMADDRAAIAFTSPPYNAGVSAQLSGNTSIDDNLYKDEYNDDQTEDDYFELLNSFTNNALSVCDYVFVNIQVLAGNKKAFIRYWNNLSDVFCDVAIWRKRQAAPAAAKRVMDSIFEFVLVFGGNGSRAIGTRDFRGMVRNVFEGDAQHGNDFSDMHAATMPIYLPEYFIKTFTNGNELIYEPFCGTGTTLVACQNLSRRGRAVEISPAYCAVTLERMSTTFPELEIKRLE